MESQAPPSKHARLSNSRTRLASGWNVERNRRDGESGSPPLGLGLELGRGGSSLRPTISCKKPYGFTVLQLQELQLQSLICTYIQAGFPVPYDLVLPIWRSVATSLGGLSSRLCQLYPSLMGCNPLYLAYKKGMEPEPGRCRRTDGKKWRCSKEALPYQKYCDRHIHRGRQRSRKLEESASHGNSSTNLSISLPAGISGASAW
ncbi:growth-regulating factor 10-like [Populus alba x Populus x berolinensis]|uniref:Growth-regulating factor n=1 Tax=Populus alba x Populus x berolinensis TaxID=444605 RepID=A0AAD6R809_9ROSI|nr:growth-regulating factor 10-like [Populus alba x Populus x berolinensis]